ncbi:hypothetical protein VEE05_04870 [Escherichia coli]|nr:hypothetical protein VEE05_04870 [Escherichia coli]
MFFKKNLTTAAICAALSVAAFSAMATDSTDTELTIIGEYTPGACTPVDWPPESPDNQYHLNK